MAGSASFATGLFTVTGAGADIWGAADAFQFVSQSVNGDAQIVAPNNGALVKLQVFIDQAMPVVEHGRCLPLASLAVAPQVLSSEQTLRRWYISQTLAGSPESAAFARLLRQSESYRLVRFLLEQSAASEKLNDLARRYGVSVSHFRRLCHQALGGAAKPELREWRSAQALLSLALSQGKSSLTEVALEFGFASSSHFSKEIRELVGVAPSSLIDITRLSSK